MNATTETKALVTVEHSDWDYSHFYDLTAVNEESALAIAKEAMENDLRPREVVSVTVDVWDGTERIEFQFDRDELRAEQPCRTCSMPGMKPSHTGSPRCESGSIASGGKNAHCTCDTCF
jgi:hypothetical protein